MLKYHLWRIKEKLTDSRATPPQYKRLDVSVQQQSTNIINTVGYLIFTVVLSDYAFLWISAQFSNSNWIHSAAGEFVENGWGLLLGILLIFYRRDRDIVRPKEFFLLKLISWLTLIAGISYFLMAPSIIANALRINHTNKVQMLDRVNLAKSQLQQYSIQLEQQLAKTTPKQLAEILETYQQQAPELPINSRQQLKQNLLTQAQQEQAQVQAELQTEFNLERKSLFKTTARWSMIAIVTGMCSLLIWKYTDWARVRY